MNKHLINKKCVECGKLKVHTEFYDIEDDTCIACQNIEERIYKIPDTPPIELKQVEYVECERCGEKIESRFMINKKYCRRCRIEYVKKKYGNYKRFV